MVILGDHATTDRIPDIREYSETAEHKEGMSLEAKFFCAAAVTAVFIFPIAVDGCKKINEYLTAIAQSAEVKATEQEVQLQSLKQEPPSLLYHQPLYAAEQ